MGIPYPRFWNSLSIIHLHDCRKGDLCGNDCLAAKWQGLWDMLPSVGKKASRHLDVSLAPSAGWFHFCFPHQKVNPLMLRHQVPGAAASPARTEERRKLGALHCFSMHRVAKLAWDLHFALWVWGKTAQPRAATASSGDWVNFTLKVPKFPSAASLSITCQFKHHLD